MIVWNIYKFSNVLIILYEFALKKLIKKKKKNTIYNKDKKNKKKTHFLRECSSKYSFILHG